MNNFKGDCSVLDPELLSTFVNEAKEQIERLVFILLQVEQNPDRQIEFINEMFRIAHNIKGSAGIMGLVQLKDVVHELESLFSLIRDNKYFLKNKVIDLLLGFTDDLTAFFESDFMNERFPHFDKWISTFNKLRGEKGENIASNHRECLPELEACSLVLSKEQKETVVSWQKAGKLVYGINVLFTSETVFPGASALIFYNELQSFGKILTTAPPREKLGEEDFSEFKIVLLCEKSLLPQEIEKIESLSFDGVKVTIRKWVSREEEQKNGDDRSTSAGTIRVEAERIDNLINQMGKMLTLKTSLLHLSQKGSYRDKTTWERLEKTLQELDQVYGELQTDILDLRMVPIKQLFSRFPKSIRDMAKQCGKKVEAQFYGEETEIDKQIVEELIDPLTHLLRNAIDHGLETVEERVKVGKEPSGRITFEARQEGSYIIIVLSDDGRGLNLEKIRGKAILSGLIKETEQLSRQEVIDLIFAPGFSTTEKVGDLSGRGVGLDVVKNAIKRLRGSIEVSTEFGKNTIFTVKIPLTLAIIQSFMVELNGQIFGIPVTDVLQSIVIKESEIHDLEGKKVYYRYPEVIPLIDLGEEFNFSYEKKPEQLRVVIVNCGRSHVGLIVEELLGLEEVMIKRVNKSLGTTRNIAGAALLGSGEIALIIDTQSVVGSAVRI